MLIEAGNGPLAWWTKVFKDGVELEHVYSIDTDTGVAKRYVYPFAVNTVTGDAMLEDVENCVAMVSSEAPANVKEYAVGLGMEVYEPVVAGEAMIGEAVGAGSDE